MSRAKMAKDLHFRTIAETQVRACSERMVLRCVLTWMVVRGGITSEKGWEADQLSTHITHTQTALTALLDKILFFMAQV
jgi:hypothetical protein